MDSIGWISNVKCQMSNFICHMSYIICQISNVKCQMPNVNKVKLMSERTSEAPLVISLVVVQDIIFPGKLLQDSQATSAMHQAPPWAPHWPLVQVDQISPCRTRWGPPLPPLHLLTTRRNFFQKRVWQPATIGKKRIHDPIWGERFYFNGKSYIFSVSDPRLLFW